MVQYSGFPVGAAKGKIVAMQVTMLKCVVTATITILDRKGAIIYIFRQEDSHTS